MNYPIWDLPASGLLIAGVAILHVFISHFAVGGGLFLVVTERRARRDRDAALLDYVRRHSRFFVLLTLVLGAITGVGIWFTIGLVHPAATSTLITTFVWFWAVEWTFFAAEITAALIYYYGWDRLSPRTHLRVGWFYFWNAWLSLVAINGILSFMLTPGDWLTTRSVWDGFLNPTCWPSLVARTAAAAAIAGLYALFTAAWMAPPDLKARLARYAGLGWIAPAVAVVALSLVWSLAAAQGAGVPVREIVGVSGDGPSAWASALARGAEAGYPLARAAARAVVVAGLVCLVLTAVIVFLRPRRYGRAIAALVLASGFVTLGGAEWVREALRKPWVIGQYMFVNGVRLPMAPDAVAAGGGDDRFTVDALDATGVLVAANWVRLPDPASLSATDVRLAEGHEVFRLECATCHTVDGHLAIRPLVSGRTVAALETTVGRLAAPVDAAGQPAPWHAPDLRVTTWRGRHMPPFVGTADERRALAMYLASLGGLDRAALDGEAEQASAGAALFDAHCAMCHGADGAWPLAERPARSVDSLVELIGRLPEVNAMMPPFEGSDDERRALAEHLSTLVGRAVPEATP